MIAVMLKSSGIHCYETKELRLWNGILMFARIEDQCLVVWTSIDYKDGKPLFGKMDTIGLLLVEYVKYQGLLGWKTKGWLNGMPMGSWMIGRIE